MLISFKLENYRTFRSNENQEKIFWMLRPSRNRTPILSCSKVANILGVGAIYGENGSGKSSLIRALKMIKEGVSYGSQFTEDGDFEIQFCHKNKYFRYSISIKEGIISDELYYTTKDKLIAKSSGKRTSLIYEKCQDSIVHHAFIWFKHQLRFVEPFEKKSDIEIAENWEKYQNLLKKFSSYVPDCAEKLTSGEKALIELEPLIEGDGKVVVCDDFGKNLHPIITQSIIDSVHLRNRESSSQFIFTTHDTSLIDTVLHPDEIHRLNRWGGLKVPGGYTEIASFSEFEGWKKLGNLRKAYMMGRFGGIPFPLHFGSVPHKCCSHQATFGLHLRGG